MIIHRKSANHAIIGIDCLEDRRLSWSAKGVIVYLQAFPDGLETLVVHLKHASTEERQEIKEVFRQLAAAGYIEFDAEAVS